MNKISEILINFPFVAVFSTDENGNPNLESEVTVYPSAPYMQYLISAGKAFILDLHVNILGNGFVETADDNMTIMTIVSTPPKNLRSEDGNIFYQ